MQKELHTAGEYALLFQQGDEKGLEYFFGEYYPALTLFASRVVNNIQVAQEIASEAFVKTWRMHAKLDSVAGIRAYLYKTVRRDAVRLSPVKKKTGTFELHEEDFISLDTPFDLIVRSETYRLVHTALKNLSPGYRKILMMHFIEGKSTGEIARELNTPVNTVKAQKLKGLRALRKTILRPMFLFFYIPSIIFFLSW